MILTVLALALLLPGQAPITPGRPPPWPWTPNCAAPVTSPSNTIPTAKETAAPERNRAVRKTPARPRPIRRNRSQRPAPRRYPAARRSAPPQNPAPALPPAPAGDFYMLLRALLLVALALLFGWWLARNLHLILQAIQAFIEAVKAFLRAFRNRRGKETFRKNRFAPPPCPSALSPNTGTPSSRETIIRGRQNGDCVHLRSGAGVGQGTRHRVPTPADGPRILRRSGREASRDRLRVGAAAIYYAHAPTERISRELRCRASPATMASHVRMKTAGCPRWKRSGRASAPGSFLRSLVLTRTRPAEGGGWCFPSDGIKSQLRFIVFATGFILPESIQARMAARASRFLENAKPIPPAVKRQGRAQDAPWSQLFNPVNSGR